MNGISQPSSRHLVNGLNEIQEASEMIPEEKIRVTTTEKIHKGITRMIQVEANETVLVVTREMILDVIRETAQDKIKTIQSADPHTMENHPSQPSQNCKGSAYIVEMITKKTTVQKSLNERKEGRYYGPKSDVSTAPKVDIKSQIVKQEIVSTAEGDTTHRFVTRRRNLVSPDQSLETRLSIR